MDSAEGSLPDGVNVDVDLDVTLSNAGGYSATLSGAMEAGGALATEDLAVTTPVVSIKGLNTLLIVSFEALIQ